MTSLRPVWSLAEWTARQRALFERPRLDRIKDRFGLRDAQREHCVVIEIVSCTSLDIVERMLNVAIAEQHRA